MLKPDTTPETAGKPARRKLAPVDTRYKAGWKIPEWCANAGTSRSRCYDLMNQQRIKSVKLGSTRIITTSPAEFLASLAKD